MPVPMKITGRSSSITNAFVNSIIPIINPTENDIKESLHILAMTPDSIECSYCGSKYTEWDHLRPLVVNKMPTGYVSEIQNLVPCCGKCNQSKGNKEWSTWIVSDAKLSPKSKNIPDLDKRIEKLKSYSFWREPTKIDFQDIVEKSLWETHWSNCSQVQERLINAQKTSDEIKRAIESKYITNKELLPNADESINHPSDGNMKIGKLVQTYSTIIIDYLVNNDADELDRLMNKKYSKDTFDINYPFLKEVDIDSPKIPRYWKNIYRVNNRCFMITSEWYQKSFPKFNLYLMGLKLIKG